MSTLLSLPRAHAMRAALAVLVLSLMVTPAMASSRGAGAMSALPADVTQLPPVPGETIVGGRAPSLTQSVMDTIGSDATLTREETFDAYVAEAWGVEPLQLQGGPAAATAEEGDHHDPHLHASSYAHADLDGDGLDDVLVVVSDSFVPEREVRAYSGADGDLLWSVDPRTVDGSRYTRLWPGGDLDGDGAEDFFVADDSFPSHDYEKNGCEDEDLYCNRETSWSSTWDIAVWSGRTGSELWSLSYAGQGHSESQERTSADDEYYREYSWHQQSTGWLALPSPTGDLDGDGLRDVVVNVIDVTASRVSNRSTGLVGTLEERADADVTTDATIIRGSDGEALEVLTYRGTGAGELRAAGDVVGDDVGDLLWTRGSSTTYDRTCTAIGFLPACTEDADTLEGITFEVVDGATRQSAWSWSTEASAASSLYDVVPLREDLDGDGKADLLLFDDWYGPLREEYMTLLSGADGTEVWSAAQRPGSIRVLDLDGAGGPDLHFSHGVLQYQGCSDGPTSTCEAGHWTGGLVVARVDGSTGGLLADTSRLWEWDADGAAWFGFSPARVPGDHDADGVIDLQISFGRVGVDSADDRSYGVIQSVATGQNLLVVDQPGFALIGSAGDLDGDGAEEVSSITSDAYLSRDLPVSYEVSSLVTGNVFWSFGSGEDSLVARGDQDGLPGEEVIRTSHTHDGAEDGLGRAYLESLTATDLARRWRVEVAPLGAVTS